jgi:hypothetical protein
VDQAPAAAIVAQNTTNDMATDFLLEVVLPCIPDTNLAPGVVANNEVSGMADLIQNDDVVICRSPDHGLVPPSRQVMEAKKLMELQSEVGIQVQGSKSDFLKRIMTMEERDQAEKEGWELNRGNEGYQ